MARKGAYPLDELKQALLGNTGGVCDTCGYYRNVLVSVMRAGIVFEKQSTGRYLNVCWICLRNASERGKS